MKKLLLTGVSFAALITNSAIAADLTAPVYKAPAVVYNWTGCYIGGDIGYGGARQNETQTTYPVAYNAGSSGGSGMMSGGHIGCNVEGTYGVARGWVVGIEADWSGTKLNGTQIAPNALLNGVPVGPGSIAFTENTKSLVSIRGRAGYAIVPDVLLYTTVGVAWNHTDYSGSDTVNGSAISFSSNKFGWVAGGGVEWAIGNSNWIARAEGLYYNISGESQLSYPPGGATSSWYWNNLGIVEGRVGLSYKFTPGISVYKPASAASYGWGSPYPKDWDKRIGEDFWTRLINYYGLEMGHDVPPPDPSAPSGRRKGWTPAPQTTPPYPYTEWPYGGATSIGVTRPNAIDSPLMTALSNTAAGKTMSDAHIQVYGWVNIGANASTNTVTPGGNFPTSYMYTPNTLQFDQAVVYIERLPDTVQQDHVDWGFRLSGMYGENTRYTTAYGVASYQLLNHNLVNGYDMPMMYGELFIPGVADGLLLRFGRFISLPDIEAQLAPNNYMYSHSLTYTFDNYTNTGIQGTLALNKNWFVQLGFTVGTEAPLWHWNQTVANPFPNAVFTGTTMFTDPGAKPSITGCVRYQTDTAHDNVYVCADAQNSGNWGYNNLQWLGMTWYHKFNEKFNVSFEIYQESQKDVLNITDPAGIIANGGYPFAPGIIQFNAPNFAQCSNTQVVVCTARALGTTAYWNYRFSGLDNLSLRTEFYNDEQGQRTGVRTRYVDVGLGLQHWLSPQVEFRPEVTYYKSLNAAAFNGNFNGTPAIPPDKYYMWLFAADVIWHY
jgi:opacity protein-like surface antigen